MIPLASFNGGITDAEAGFAFLAVVSAAILAGCRCGKVWLGAFYGAVVGVTPCVWFMFLSTGHRPDFSDILLLGLVPVGGFVGGMAGLLTRVFGRKARVEGGKRGPDRATGVGDRGIDG